MAEKPVLVVLAAGMGSRYGGLKQIDPVGMRGEAILDYSIYDAHAAGFRRVVIIIKEAIREEFFATVGRRLANAPVSISYAWQELSRLPDGYRIPDGRTKPWGTAHALLCAADAIGDAPFAVINADDYYGKAAFRTMYDFLQGAHRPDQFCMIGYRLGNTITAHGSVTRGICQVDSEGMLTAIRECRGIEAFSGGIRFPEEDTGEFALLSPDTMVSMNMWGFSPYFLTHARDAFPGFLDCTLARCPQTGEFLLPTLVSRMLLQHQATVRVLPSEDQWYGVTYAADKPAVTAALRRMTEQGLYPVGLWPSDG